MMEIKDLYENYISMGGKRTYSQFIQMLCGLNFVTIEVLYTKESWYIRKLNKEEEETK